MIAGSGPAGLTAALYCARARLEPVLVEGEPSGNDQPGGQLMLTTEVENYPGFPDGVLGPDLMASMRAQALRFGAQIVGAKASRFELDKSPFSVWTGDPASDGPAYEAEAVIVATGARALMLGVPGEDRLLGYGVSTCATCDGFFFRGQRIAVVGGGDSAIEDALFLTRFADKVTIVHRRDRLRASQIMQERALANPKIELAWTQQVVEVLGDQKVSGVRLRHSATGKESELELQGLFVAIGHEPNTAVLRGELDLDEHGYLVTHDGTRTNVEGVFACGDVQDRIYRQAVTAAGTGCMAAIDAERWLEARGS
ncbi:MAG: thioredoxin-disulfide reductase [Acidimicrobiales bacterium]